MRYVPSPCAAVAVDDLLAGAKPPAEAWAATPVMLAPAAGVTIGALIDTFDAGIVSAAVHEVGNREQHVPTVGRTASSR